MNPILCSKSIARMSHTLRPSIRRGPGIRPSITKRSNIVADTPQEFAAYIKSEIPKWTAIVKASGASMSQHE